MMNEEAYLNLMNDILQHGEYRDNRTGIRTLSLFGQKMEFDLTKGFPLLTTKKVFFDKIVSELLFFISGKTDTTILEQNGNCIWKGNTSSEFLSSRNLPWREGDMGPGYSFQWRHCGAEYQGCDKDYTGQGVDQLQQLIDGLKNDPFSRRHIINSWCVKDIDKMALPPCHCMVQFYVSQDRGLTCLLYQRSADFFLGVPFNIASYSLLTFMIASICDLVPKKFIHVMGDTHIYENHIEQCRTQLSRKPYDFPKISFPKRDNISDYTMKDFILSDYHCHPYIKGDMAI